MLSKYFPYFCVYRQKMSLIGKSQNTLEQLIIRECLQYKLEVNDVIK